ncbi:MAG: oligoendopeptidase F [candidate division Zixibacteria bacterium]|nr:oligoendopeptidase F [candidate division Zixibacteria bacterium]
MKSMQHVHRGILSTLGILLVFVLASSAFAEPLQEIPTRDQIDDKYKWDLTAFSPSDSAWETEIATLAEALPSLAKYEGKLGTSADVLAECLTVSDSLQADIHRLYVYANLKRDEDNRVSKYQEMSQRSSAVYGQFYQYAAFIEPEITAIPDETITSFLSSGGPIELYRFYLEDIVRRKAHIMSPEVERVLALSRDVVQGPQNIFTMLDDADITYGTVHDEDGNEIELTKERYSKLSDSKNRKVRKEASDTYNAAYDKYLNTMGATLAASVNADVFQARARGYETCLDASLDANNIPTSVFHNLIKAVTDNLEPLHKYVSLRKKYLGYDTLFAYDMWFPLVEGVDKEYTFEEAKELVLQALKPLGKEYVKNLDMGMNSRWIDVYETQGKGSGGYSWCSYDAHPIVLLNWNKSLTHVYTLAHEMGHALHSYYTNKNEPGTYSGHSLFCAEVASTCNESIFARHLLDNTADHAERMYILENYIQQIIGTFYSQAMFSEFELMIHETVENGGALTTESMRKMYRDLYQKYYGPEMFVEEGKDIGCLRISHFYRQYYVYQYATSYAASQVLSKKILDGEPGAREAYLKFISTGTSDYPVNILKKAGIDMTTTEPFANVIQIFSGLVDEYEKELQNQ